MPDHIGAEVICPSCPRSINVIAPSRRNLIIFIIDSVKVPCQRNLSHVASTDCLVGALFGPTQGE